MDELHNYALTLTDQGTPDPFMVAWEDQFFLIFTSGDRIEIWSSHSLLDFRSQAKSHVIWKPPTDTDHSDGLWAPELHNVRGRWYVYYAAGHSRYGNKSHRMWVLSGGPSSRSPVAGPWEFSGLVQGLPKHQWAIDGTIFDINDSLYFVYSGWPLNNVDQSDLEQQLFIVRMATPTLAESAPVAISIPTFRWEISTDGKGDHKINEGPQFLKAPNGQWQGIVYSCAGSWTRNYKMGMLHFVGGNPLDPRAWQKDTKPLFQTAPASRGPYGPGHGNFIRLNGQTLAVFHATDSPFDGWSNRKARLQVVRWTQHGPSIGDGFVGPIVSDFAAYTKVCSPSESPPRQEGFRTS